MSKSSDERTFTEQARRAQIVTAAVDVLADEGFRAASLQRIAQRAGVSKPLILYHFDSKDELLRQVLFDTVGAMSHAAVADLDLVAPPPDVLRDLVHRSAEVGVSHRRERRAVQQIITNLGPGRDGGPVVMPSDAGQLHDALEGLFRAGQASGHFRADLDTRVMAITYQAAIDAMHTHIDTEPDADPVRYADSLVDILLAAVRPR